MLRMADVYATTLKGMVGEEEVRPRPDSYYIRGAQLALQPNQAFPMNSSSGQSVILGMSVIRYFLS